MWNGLKKHKLYLFKFLLKYNNFTHMKIQTQIWKLRNQQEYHKCLKPLQWKAV